jgi:hypothetical protein
LEHSTFDDLADKYTILLAQSGSRLHGLDTADSDDDRMGVLCEPPEYVIGVERFEQYKASTSTEGARSGRGDCDVTVYSLRKWVRMAGEGNPNALLLAFTPDEAVITETAAGRELRGLAPAFASRAAADRFIGYLDGQRAALLGLKGKKTTRAELVEQYGFDTKWAMHMVRLGWQGVDLLATGRITLPMPEDAREWLLGLRCGERTRQEALDMAAEARARLVALRAASFLPEHAHWKGLNTWLRTVYLREWDRHNLI